MRDIFEKYGLHADRRGFMCCPFHKEKTPSFGIYAENKRWHCFGCGEGGDVISFVMKMFGLSFAQAIYKINYDFNLNLGAEAPKTIREQRRIANAEKKHIELLSKKRMRIESNRQKYDELLAEWIRLESNKRRYKPINPNDEWDELYIESLRNIDRQSYLLDCFEVIKE